MAEPEVALQVEVTQRLGRPWPGVQQQLEHLFGREWDECEIFITTSASKKGRSEADVIVELIAKAETKPPVVQQARRKVIRWIGKPWREREDPWNRFKDRVPPAGRPRKATPDDLEEWTPLKPDNKES